MLSLEEFKTELLIEQALKSVVGGATSWTRSDGVTGTDSCSDGMTNYSNGDPSTSDPNCCGVSGGSTNA